MYNKTIKLGAFPIYVSKMLSTEGKALITEQFENVLLHNILPFWMTITPDKKNGGFYGQIGVNNAMNNDIPRTAVTCSRILWTFSHAFLIYKNKDFLEIANRAFDYLYTAFWDKENEGLYWSVDLHGNPVFDHKHFYAQAFGIYGFSEYFRATQNSQSLSRAIQLFNIIEEHAFDPKNGGYIESKSREFQPIVDMRLSEKDMNCRKSMNTLLHIIEAYANLLLVWDNRVLKNQLCKLIGDFNQHVFNERINHLQLFFDDDWSSLSDHISCGHDIESSWLIHEAAEIIGAQELIDDATDISLRLANSVLASGINEDGSVIYEGTKGKITDPGKEWWPHAEAIIGFYNAYQLSGKNPYLDTIQTVWNYLHEHFIDNKNGGWFKRLNSDGSLDLSRPKVGPWECPYHESRMCFEMIKRLRKQEKENGE